jgi:hypothetical protein
VNSTTGAIRHPDVSEISDLTEGILSPDRTAEIRGHLTGCALCADVRTSLEEIRGLLGTLPGPQRMPADIAGRIDAALAAEALLDATSPKEADSAVESGAPADRTAPDVSRETLPQRPERRSAAKPGDDRPAGRPRAGTGPGRTRSRRRVALVGTALAGTAVVFLGLFFARGLPSGSFDGAEKGATTQSVQAAPAISSDNLEEKIQQLLGEPLIVPKSGTSPQAESFGSDTADARAVLPGSLPACVQAGTGREGAPLAVERGVYQGKDAFLLLYPHPGDGTRTDAFVVDASCEGTAPGGRGKVLLDGTYARP